MTFFIGLALVLFGLGTVAYVGELIPGLGPKYMGLASGAIAIVASMFVVAIGIVTMFIGLFV